MTGGDVRSGATPTRWPARAGVAALLALAVTTGAAVPANAAATPRAHSAFARLSAVHATRVLQRALGLHADGVFGPRTEAAVRAVQARHGLAASGVVGPATWRALGLPVLRTLRLGRQWRPAAPAADPVPAAPAPPSAASPATAGYGDPFAGDAVVPERIDMGVDYSAAPGTPIRAMGTATILQAEAQGSGWPGGGYVVYQLTGGPYAGDCVYVAEDVVPAVTAGQSVAAGATVATFTAGASGIETGWALPDGETLATALGEDARGLADPSHDPGRYSTGAGVHYAQLLSALGAPAGLLSPGGVQGPIAAP